MGLRSGLGGGGAARGAAVLLALAVWAAPAARGTEAAEALRWPAATRESRPWSYWWWMGSAVDPANLTREIQQYRRAGWGGLHIIPIYGAKGYEARYIRYLTPEWMAMLRHSVQEAERADMGVDMTTGTGWCFGGPQIGEREACATLVVKTYEAPAGAGPEAHFDRRAVQALVAFSEGRPPLELTDRIGGDGRLNWRAEGSAWRLYAVSQQLCRTPVKRAAPGGEGPMLNPFYGEAIRRYLERFSEAFAGYPGPKPRAMYHDSFEYGANWSPDLFAEFERRRGYRLQSELPALLGEGPAERTARVKADYRETLSDLMAENFLPVWTEWCRRHGFRTRNQAHGSPGNLLDLYAAADIPETEMFHLDRSTLVSKFASSAAHVAGRRLVASETGTWLREHFNETLAELKELADQLFVAGVNHIFYHGSCYSPAEAPWPGWVFYASTQMNPRNPIWRDVPALNDYVTRCQSVLQAGQPDNELLVYWPIYDLWQDPQGLNLNLTVHRRDWLEKQPLGATAARLWKRGYTFDYVSDRGLGGLQADGGSLKAPGASYKALVTPSCRLMPPATLERMLELAAAGATVIFEGDLPKDVPGLGRLEERREALRKLSARLSFGAAGGRGVRRAGIGAGQVLAGDLEAALEAAGIERERLADREGMEFVRRSIAGGRYYFIANRGAAEVEDWIPLSGRAASAVLMDPMSGRTGLGATRASKWGGLEVYLQLQPGESMIVRTARERIKGPAWTYWKVAGPPVPIGGRWQVRALEGGPEMPPPYETAVLGSWTVQGAAWERFAGTAAFQIVFDAPASRAEAWRIELGRVCESARVRLNGRDLGTLLMPPYRVTAAELKPRGNLLEVEVTNVAANRIRDMDLRKTPWRLFHDINFVNIQYRPFDASGWPVRDSGLLGPVRLQPLKKLGAGGP
jgi:hypothetical protein